MPTNGANFSPPAGIPATIKQLIDAATVRIRVCIFVFTEPTLAAALAAAVTRGVDVQVIIDYNSAYQTTSMAWQLSRSGVQVFTDHAHTQLHTKYAIFDDVTICTGSANWTQNADGLAGEDLWVMTPGYPFNAQYIDNWNFHRSHSIALPR